MTMYHVRECGGWTRIVIIVDQALEALFNENSMHLR